MTTTTFPLSQQQLPALFAAMRRVRVGIIGDAGVDVYWEADMTKSRLARENPFHFRPIVAERITPGGGANTAACAAALPVAGTRMLSIIGDDWRGRELIRALGAVGVNPDDLIIAPERTTLAYCKPRLHGLCEAVYEDAHLYFENFTSVSEAVEQALLARLEGMLPEIDVLIVSDYLRFGTLTPALRARINDAGRAGMRILVDSRDHLADYTHAILKPNETEAQYLCEELGWPAPDDLTAFSRLLQARTEAPVCFSRGSRGCLWYDHGVSAAIPALPVTGPLDTVGAGDCFGVTLAVTLAAGFDGPTAAALATLAANIVIHKVGTTGQATQAELLHRAQEVLQP